MKKYLLVLMVIMISVLPFNALAADGDYQIVGGYLYTTLDPGDLNSVIANINEMGQEVEIWAPEFITYNDLGKIEDGQGFYVGIARELDNQAIVTGQYERFSTDASGSLVFNFEENNHTESSSVSCFSYNEIKLTADYDLEVQGVSLNYSPRVNDWLTLNGGIGYYWGDLDLNAAVVGKVDDESESLYDYSNNLELGKNIGWKLGLGINKPLKDNVSFLANLNYRVLDLDIEEDEDLNNLPEDFRLPTSDDFSGYELTVGIGIAF